jgi:long-chain acyl-CoA synthetase
MQSMHPEHINEPPKAPAPLMLDYVYAHEMARANQVFLSQPLGGGQVKDYTWAQTMDQARRMATHIKSLALEPGARIAILSKNCAHFFIAELAIWLAGGTTVAIFPTETAETIRYVLQHSGASLLFVGKLDLWEQQAAAVPTGLHCIAMPLAPATPFEGWDAITRRTAPLTGRVMRGASEIAMLVYTSGSTGQPKGVMHSFAGVTASSLGMQHYLQQALGADTDIRVLSYLPLAHIYERAWIECTALVNGRTQVFFAESLDTFLLDLNRARPNVFASVPRLWLKFQQGVFHKIPAHKLDRLLRIPLLGRLVGRRVLKGLGLDQVLLAASGSAPIPPELIAWYRRLGLNLLEGYAMTEDFAYSHASSAHFSAPGCVGIPLPGVQVRLSVDGEVQLKSPGQMVGYYKQADLDAEVFTSDGFFRTGDQGERTADGLLRLTGRVKELFKSSKGKYIAPAPIENLLNAHPMVELSMVSGVGQPAAYALLVLAEPLRARIGETAVRTRVEHALTQLLKDVNLQLSDYEQLRMLVVESQPWTVENGLLTPTMKIRRNRIETAVQARLQNWYASPGPLCWD